MANSTLFMVEAPKLPKGSGDTQAVLVMLYPPGPNLGRRFPLTAPEHVVGRLAELDIPIESDSVSRRHARFYRADDGWAVEDLGSTNGTFVNDLQVDKRTLRDGDLVRFGGAILKFLSGANIEAAYHEEIYRMSILDGLTGVHNKRYFLEFLDRELAGAARHQLPLCLVMFDIDHFKKVNDTHGHLAGDAVLKELAKRLKPRIRREDLLARYGGEEFTCVLTKTPHAGALAFAESLRAIIGNEPFPYDQTLLPVTISLGVAEFHAPQPIPPDEIIRRADENLYAAKKGGRNRVVG
jgi:diguanylate cyclase (GGDEF)-like protein